MDNTFYEAEEISEQSENRSAVPPIDPKDPFGNFTEYREYNSDYREVVPQIDIPGCEIPFKASPQEKKRIRFYFNAVGICVAVHYLVVELLLSGAVLLIRELIMKADNTFSWEVTERYLIGIAEYVESSAIGIGLTLLIMMTCNLLLFFIGSAVTKVKIGSYFKGRDVTVLKVMSYCLISFCVQYIGSMLTMLFSAFADGADPDVGRTITGYGDIRAIIVALMYGCIVAPVTEELVFRGFVLKNLSRVGQRFGIIASALLFGLVHRNMNQFIGAFLFGIFLGHITVKHNTIVPAMIVHAFSNSYVMFVTYSGIRDTFAGMAGLGTIYLALSIAGAVLLINFRKKDRLPYTMPHQKIRNGTAVTSVMLVFAVLMYSVITVCETFPDIRETFNEYAEEIMKVVPK